MKYSNDNVIEVLNKYFKIEGLKPTRIANIYNCHTTNHNYNKSTVILVDKHILRLTISDDHGDKVFSFDLRVVKHPWVSCFSRWFIKSFVNTGDYDMTIAHYHSQLFRLLIESCGNHAEVILYYGFKGILYDENTEMISLNFSYFDNEFHIQFPKDKSHLEFTFKNNNGGEFFSCSNMREFCKNAAEILDREFV